MRIPDFSKARILVVGDLMLDSYWYGVTSRISPEAPVPVVKVGNKDHRPGGAANVALNISALRSGVTVLGVTGKDEESRLLEQALSESGVDAAIIKEPSVNTVVKLRVISQQQQLIRLDFEDAPIQFRQQALLDLVEERLADVDVLLVSDYAKGTMEMAPQVIQLARRFNKPVFVDPKGDDFTKYRGAYLITPNMAEFEAVAGRCNSEQEIEQKAAVMISQLEIEALLVTRGEKGMSLFQSQRKPLHLPTQAREVFDVTGAGDAVISTLASSHAAGASLEDATALANLAAGVVVGKLGAATATEAEIRLMLKASYGHQQGVMDVELLKAMVQASRDKGERLVMTNGCFDILHPGHVNYLEQARQMGDRLIVAVNSDASVRKLKGEDRPVNTLEMRMAVLSGLSAVDWVVPFSDETPEQLIRDITPDVLVKGGDYKPRDIAGHDFVVANGGEVTVLPFVDGCSTSHIIDIIRAR